MSQKLNIEVWSQSNCPGCNAVKSLLESKGHHDFVEKLLGVTAEKEELFSKAPNVRSIPQVFINNKHIGGLQELQEYFKAQ